jgi:hypothetical protein
MGWFANVTDRRRYDVMIEGEVIGWVELRQELSVGERRQAFGNAIKGQTQLADGNVRTEYDHAKLSFGLVVAYLSEWSEKGDLTDYGVRASAVEALSPDVYDAIEKIVDKHAEEYGKRPQKRQKRKSSVEAISPSAA